MKKILVLPVLFSLIFLSNCGLNIFSSPDSMKELTADGLIMLGNEQMQQKNYNKALEYYTKATIKEPLLADAWYFKAKAELRSSGVLLDELVKELQNEDTKKLPFFPDSTLDTTTVIRTVTYRNETGTNSLFSVYAIDTLYDKLVTLIQPCFKAYDDLSRIFDGRAPNGTFKEKNIRLDFTMLSSLRTAMISLDMNKDGILDPTYTPYNTERKLYKVMGKGLTNINDINIDVNSIRSLYSGPDDINGMIEGLVASAAISLSAISNLDAEIQASSATGVDKGMMTDSKKQMETIILKANYYKYNDHKDNDNDGYDTNHDSLVQRTIWIDTNGNDCIDWTDPSSGISYNLTDLFGWLRRDSVLIQPTSGLPAPWIDTVAHRYDSNYFYVEKVGEDKFYLFKKGNGGEFVAGDWGVDEEQLDDHNSDGDGIKDEDSRVASDSLDNDGDFIKIYTDVSRPDSDAYYGTRQSGKKAIDTRPLSPTFGQLCNTAKMAWVDFNHDCRITGPTGVAITRQYVIDSFVVISARLNSGQPYGEWIAGDWGVDEEYVDGIDNDGDGRIDEDGDVHLVHRSPIWDAARTDYIISIKDTLSHHPEYILGVK
ncbi:MAG: hypothetical protein V1913_08460 [Fibrobacterota bacterium]